MAVIIGSARIDEYGRAHGGAAGDQKQTATPDYKGEVSMQRFYVSPKGWFVLRPRNVAHAAAIAKNMQDACNNKNLGYDQYQRLGVISKGIHSTTKTECDCSSLVRACIKEATGIDPGDFTTVTERGFLERTGLFEPSADYKSGMPLYAGDVLVTKTRGHTVIVISGYPRAAAAPLECADPKPANQNGAFKPYKVKIKVRLNVRSTPDTNDDSSIVTTIRDYGVYTIVGEQNGMGKLKSGLGWISLNPKFVDKL